MELKDVSNQIADVASRYHFHKPPEAVVYIQEQLGKLWRMVLEWLDSVFHLHLRRGSDSHAVSDFMVVLLYLLAIAGASVFLVYLSRRVRANKLRERVMKQGAAQIEEILDAAGWKGQAKNLAASHDYRGACRALYLSLLQNMHENDVAEFAPAKTNYEYAYTLKAYPDIQAPFKEIAQMVEVFWFGNQQATLADFESSLAKLTQLEREVIRAGAERRRLQERQL